MIKYLNQPKGPQKKILYIPMKAMDCKTSLTWTEMEVYMKEQNIYKNLVKGVEVIPSDLYQQMQLNGNFSLS